MPSKSPDAEHLAALTGRQILAIASLLKHGTVPAAAAELGMSERQLRRWAALPAFARALRAERRVVMDGVTSKLAAGAGEAVAALLEVVRDKKAASSARVAGARVLIESARGAVSDADLAARLARIEALADGRAPSPAAGDDAEPAAEHAEPTTGPVTLQ